MAIAAMRTISITAIINNICNIASLIDVEAFTLTIGSQKKLQNFGPNLSGGFGPKVNTKLTL